MDSSPTAACRRPPWRGGSPRYGARGQLGNMLWLTNLRFDFVLLGALAGPAVLGIYAVASKFAELMRLAPTAINYVLYPRFAKLGSEEATIEARRLLPQATMLTLVMTPFVAIGTLVGPVLLYGSAFRGAVVPAEIIIFGLSIEGAAAVSSAYLLGVGRPGLNSVGMGVGASITVTLDLILIPKYGALGGAITSAVTYRGDHHHVDVHWLPGRPHHAASPSSVQECGLQLHHGGVRLDTAMRRTVDAVTAFVALVVVSPLLVATAVAVKATSRGPALYKQIRAGPLGPVFTMLKFRSMVQRRREGRPTRDGNGRPAGSPGGASVPGNQDRRVAAALQRPERGHDLDRSTTRGPTLLGVV